MALAKEVARATGWRLLNFPYTSCRDFPLPPNERPRENNSTDYTLNQFLEDSIHYAQTERAKIQKRLECKKQYSTTPKK